MTRISKTIVVIDYAYPQPKSFGGLAVRLIERMAGDEHNRNFKAFLKMGGICEIAKELGCAVDVRYGGKNNIFTIALLQMTDPG